MHSGWLWKSHVRFSSLLWPGTCWSRLQLGTAETGCWWISAGALCAPKSYGGREAGYLYAPPPPHGVPDFWATVNTWGWGMSNIPAVNPPHVHPESTILLHAAHTNAHSQWNKFHHRLRSYNRALVCSLFAGRIFSSYIRYSNCKLIPCVNASHRACGMCVPVWKRYHQLCATKTLYSSSSFTRSYFKIQSIHRCFCFAQSKRGSARHLFHGPLIEDNSDKHPQTKRARQSTSPLLHEPDTFSI